MLLTSLALALLALPQEPVQDSPLDQVTAARIRADIRFLADDALLGRDTPSVGLGVAAGFLIARLQRLGLEPAGSEGYRQPFPLTVRRIDPDATFLKVIGETGTRHFVMGEDYYPERLSHLVQWQAEGPLVSGGTGEAVEVAAAASTGRWVVMFDAGGKVRPALQRFAEAGAAGVLLTPGPDYSQDTYEARFAATAERMLSGLTTRKTDKGLKGPDLPVVMLPPETWQAIAGLSSEVDLLVEEVPEAGTDLLMQVIDRRTPIDPDGQASNVVARMTGSDPARAHEVVLLLAHYDAQGAPGGEVHAGADDNASGSAALLAIAEALAAHGPLDRTVMLLWTAGNTKGRLGVESWAAGPTLGEGERVVLAIELDAIGLGERSTLTVTPGPTLTWHSEWLDRFKRHAADEGFPVLPDGDLGWPRSEARVLARALTIPVVSISAGKHDNHRTVDDVVFPMKMKKIARAARAVWRLVLEAGG